MSTKTEPNMVTSPPHYKDAARVECITIIEDLGFGFNLGSVLKYVWRAGRKASADKSIEAKKLQDLEKARYYLDREVVLLGGKSWNPDKPAEVGGTCLKGGCLQLNGHDGECDS